MDVVESLVEGEAIEVKSNRIRITRIKQHYIKLVLWFAPAGRQLSVSPASVYLAEGRQPAGSPVPGWHFTSQRVSTGWPGQPGGRRGWCGWGHQQVLLLPLQHHLPQPTSGLNKTYCRVGRKEFYFYFTLLPSCFFVPRTSGVTWTVFLTSRGWWRSSTWATHVWSPCCLECKSLFREQTKRGTFTLFPCLNF